MGSPYSPGDVLAGRYRLERVIGEGGMGVVLAAEHIELGERVAVKVLLPDAQKIKDAVTRFQREARAAARIPSEHVARVMDVGTLEDGTPYLVMEYVEGRDLSAELDARGPLPIDESVDYVLQAAVGVSEAHAIGIVHRDLKPSNLFLARIPGGRTMVKVLDFGIAKLSDETDINKLTKSFSALGSISYMSPEQLRAARDVDSRADVWALGVVLFELLTGRMPFNGETVTAIASSITADQPHSLRSFRPDAPQALEAVIFGCLNKERHARTPSLAVLAKALEPFGRKNAPMLVSRIIDVAPASTRGSLPSIASLPEPPLERSSSPLNETKAIGPTWTSSEDFGPPTIKDHRGRRLAITLGAIGVLVLGALAIGVVRSNRAPEAPVVAATNPVPPPGTAPAPSATEETSAEVAETSEPETAQSATPVTSAAPRVGKMQTKPAEKKPTKRVKKPLVTDL